MKGRRLSLMTLVAALAATTAAAQVQPATVTITGTLEGADRLQVRVSEPSYVLVFAVGRHPRWNPVQLLMAEREPKRLKPGETYTPRRLTTEERRRFGVADETVVLAIASATKPSIAPFIVPRDGDNLLLLPDSVVGDGQRLINSLAREVLAANVPFAAALRQDLVAYLPPSRWNVSAQRDYLADWQTAEAYARCAPSGVPIGIGAALNQLSLTNTDPFVAVDFASGGQPVDVSGGVRWAYVGTQLRNGCAEFSVAPFPIPYRGSRGGVADSALAAVRMWPAGPSTDQLRSTSGPGSLQRTEQGASPYNPSIVPPWSPGRVNDQPVAPIFIGRSEAPSMPEREPMRMPERGPDRAPEPMPAPAPAPAPQPPAPSMPEPSPDRPPVPAPAEPVRIPMDAVRS